MQEGKGLAKTEHSSRVSPELISSSGRYGLKETVPEVLHF